MRWRHPEMGLISPGVFIPLFEENGMIQQLDEYVWREAAAQIREWKDRLGFSIPVSVNVSRIDLYDSKLEERILAILKKYDLDPGEYYLEITESAYSEDTEQFIEVVRHLQSLGLKVEMDDFGAGYSSLSMLSSMPMDVLKLDMQFAGTIEQSEKNYHLTKLMIGLGKYMEVPVVAEGVETMEQLELIKKAGCDIVQGYYFSRPVSKSDFEKYIIEKKERSIG